MRLFSKKKSSLDRRLSDLEKEIERVSYNLRNAEKRMPNRNRTVSDRKNRQGAVKRDSVAPVSGNRQAPVHNDHDIPIAGEKFANYFTAGHFQNLRPLRQERRIVRNKAIVMVLIVLLVLIWVLLVVRVK